MMIWDLLALSERSESKGIKVVVVATESRLSFTAANCPSLRTGNTLFEK